MWVLSPARKGQLPIHKDEPDIAIAHAFGINGETRVIFNEPDEYGGNVLGYNVWSVLQVAEGYNDTENLPEGNTAALTPETALAIHDAISHPDYEGYPPSWNNHPAEACPHLQEPP